MELKLSHRDGRRPETTTTRSSRVRMKATAFRLVLNLSLTSSVWRNDYLLRMRILRRLRFRRRVRFFFHLARILAAAFAAEVEVKRESRRRVFF